MTRRLLLPLWLALLALSSGLPATGLAAHSALPSPASPSSAAHPPISIAGARPYASDGLASDSPATPNLRFDCFSAADGLSFSLATSILQDRRGFMWFGTRYGLDKYDGNRFTTYLPWTGGDVMGGNFIIDLHEDQAGDLWMATYIDVVRRSGRTGEFVHYDASGLTPGRINVIAEDPAGTIWVGTNGGLNRYDRAADAFTRVLEDEAVLSIHVDRRGGIWLGTAGGAWHYGAGSLGQRNPVQYRNDPADPASLSDDIVIAIHEDSQGVVWVGTQYGGLNRLDAASGRFTRYLHNPADPYSLSDDRVYTILEDSSGRLWVGTQDGLNLLDRRSGRFFQYHYKPDDTHGLSNDVIDDIYQDRAGVVWVATLAGVCKVNEVASAFAVYRQGSYPAGPQAGSEPGGALALSDNLVLSLYQDGQGVVWAGTSQGGLNRLDRRAGRVTVYRYSDTDPGSITRGEVTAIYEDKAGTFWVGTSGGLNRFNPQTGRFQAEAALAGNSVSSVVEDQQGSLWLGTWDGLMRREAGARAFSPVPLVAGSSVHHRVQRLYVDRAGALWISTQNDGLFRLVPASAGGGPPAITHLPQDPADPKSPGNSPVMGFYEDAQGVLWLGTVEDGLVRYDSESRQFRHFLPDTAGAARYVSCIRGDAGGRLWMGTGLGLARFNPGKETFSYLDARDGLKVGEGISCFHGQQGEMLFGTWGGLVAFFPDQIRDSLHPPEVVINSLNLRGQVLRTDLVPDEEIRLSYEQNYLSFDFAALDYAAPAKNLYAYRMEGLDEGWVMAGTRRHADYPDIKPGSYTFRVKASNSSGVWNEQGAAVRITITPPIWQTWWFLGLVGLALVGVAAGGVRLRLKGVEARSRDLERLVNERTGALAQRTVELQQRTLETERRRQELEALLSADDRMHRCLHQDQVLQALVDVAVDISRADKSAVIWWDERLQRLAIRVSRGFSQRAVEQLQFARGQGIVGGVALRGEPVLVEDAATDPRRSLEDPLIVQVALDEGIRSFMFFPITIGEDVLGVFNVSYLKTHAAGEGERRLFQALAQRAALYLENARLYEQSQQLAVLEERGRLARDLHDAVTQTLFSASLVAEALPATWERDREEGRDLLVELRGLCRGALAEMRTLLLELRPARLAETKLEDLLRQLGEATSGRAGIPVAVQVEGLVSLPPDVHIALYRIAQEALNNVVKHARARQATVRLSCKCRDQAAGPAPGAETGATAELLCVLLSVSDDGRGFDPAQVPQDRLGLGIMSERAQAVGAHLTIASRPGGGTEVTVQWEQGGKQEAR